MPLARGAWMHRHFVGACRRRNEGRRKPRFSPTDVERNQGGFFSTLQTSENRAFRRPKAEKARDGFFSVFTLDVTRSLFAAVAVVVLAAALCGCVGPATAEPESLLACARAEAQRNFAAFTQYTCEIESARQVWKIDGEAHKNNLVHKKLFVRPPDVRQETFVSGTINGQPAKENDFLWERFGLNKGLNVSDIECLRPGAETLFELVEKPGRVIEFVSLAPGKTAFQKGTLQLAEGSCRVTRLTGRFVHKTIVRNIVDFDAYFEPVTKSVWLPEKIRIRGDVSLGIVKRRIDATDHYKNYDLTAKDKTSG